ncbi:MAG: hypothetical protein R2806_19945 [Saprospiraceae bacterium]
MKQTKHKHIYDSQGRQTVAHWKKKIDKTPPPLLKAEHSEHEGHDHSHDHSHQPFSRWLESISACHNQFYFVNSRNNP